jgi:DNA-binding protein H-NS
MDLEALSVGELDKLIRDAAAVADKKRATHKKDVRKRCVELIRSEGLSLADVFPETAQGGAGKQPTFPIANPDNPAELYHGKGRRPSWLTQALLDAAS